MRTGLVLQGVGASSPGKKTKWGRATGCELVKWQMMSMIMQASLLWRAAPADGGGGVTRL